MDKTIKLLEEFLKDYTMEGVCGFWVQSDEDGGVPSVYIILDLDWLQSSPTKPDFVARRMRQELKEDIKNWTGIDVSYVGSTAKKCGVIKNIDESISPYLRRRLSFEDMKQNIENLVDYELNPCQFSNIGDFVTYACDMLVYNYIEDLEMSFQKISPREKDTLYYFFVDNFGNHLANVYKQRCVKGLKESKKRIIVTESQYRTIMENGLDVEPSKTAVKNICDSKKFCSAQGKITFGQLKELVKAASKTRLYKHIGEGGFKATIRLIPFFLPQLMIPGVIAGAARAINKILKPGLTETENYKTFWGKSILRAFKLSEGDLDLEDPLSKIFFISDGLMTMMDDKYKIKFARYIADLADEKSNDEEVPDYFVENELRKWVNNKFLLDPPLPPKISDNQDLDLDDQETLQEQKKPKIEVFQELINDGLEYIRGFCDDSLDAENYSGDVGFDSCDVVDTIDSIKVNEVNRMKGARTDMEGNMYDSIPSIYIKLTINFSYIREYVDFDNIVYDLKHFLRKSTGGLPIVLDYEQQNLRTNREW